YHSLAVVEHTLPDGLEVSSYTSRGEVMGVRHRSQAIEGVQFHPESVLSPEGPQLLANFLMLETNHASA
ncbi:MAG: para-aminobenzoate synthetase component 2, partial [Myxococcota bacterium]